MENREIKFRAFHKEKNKMINFSFHDLYGLAQYYQDIIFRIETPIMMFTGLKDKEGNEIYEGNELSVMDLTCNGEHIKYFPGGHVFYEKGAWMIGFGYLFDHYKDCKITGNIHFNPELLEK